MRPPGEQASGRGAAARRRGGFSKPRCAVAAGRARASGEPGAAQSPQARAGGVGARRGAARAAPGPGEWSNLTAGTRRRRAAGNGGGGGGAGRHREAWAVTRAPERGPMVLEGPRRPVLQVRRAPAGRFVSGPGGRLCPARLLSEARVGNRPRCRAQAGDGPRGFGSPGNPEPELLRVRVLGGAGFDRSCSAFEAGTKPGGTHAGRRPGSDPGLPNGAGPLDAAEDQEGDKAAARCRLEPWEESLSVYWQVTRAGPKGRVAEAIFFAPPLSGRGILGRSLS